MSSTSVVVTDYSLDPVKFMVYISIQTFYGSSYNAEMLSR